MLDLRIDGALVVDGSGIPARRASVGVTGGRIVSVTGTGEEPEPARRVVDAGGLVLVPGFIDLHTHYDAQLFWDPAASPSPLHGVTTVFGGNCGFTLAPAKADDAAYLTQMLARVEGMPLEALEAGLDWGWSGFGSWLDRLEGNVTVNAGFLVGHSALRRNVLGDEATDGTPTADQQRAMEALLHESLAAGGMGFSTSQAPTHNDGGGRPVPSRAADRDELLKLASVVAEHAGTTVSLVLAGSLAGFTDDEMTLLGDLSLASRRPVNWNVLGVSAGNPAQHLHQLEASDRATERGGRVVALVLPHTMKLRLSFLTGFLLDGFPGWGEVMALPPAEKLEALRRPEVRRKLAEGAASDEAGMLRGLARWKRMVVAEVFCEANADAEGHTVGEVAAQRGGDPFDVLCDIVIADDLRTGLEPPLGSESDEEYRARAEVWTDDRTVVGGSDAGAHLDMMCGAIATTSLLADGVRRHGAISLEEAVRQLTDVPARLYGLRDRGRIAEGYAADLVLFDPARVDHGRVRTRYDLPSGAPRLYAEAEGIEAVWVNGTEIVRDGELTGATPGRVLRSGRDTDTVAVAGA